MIFVVGGGKGMASDIAKEYQTIEASDFEAAFDAAMNETVQAIAEAVEREIVAVVVSHSAADPDRWILKAIVVDDLPASNLADEIPLVLKDYGDYKPDYQLTNYYIDIDELNWQKLENYNSLRLESSRRLLTLRRLRHKQINWRDHRTQHRA